MTDGVAHHDGFLICKKNNINRFINYYDNVQQKSMLLGFYLNNSVVTLKDVIFNQLKSIQPKVNKTWKLNIGYIYRYSGTW